jgi:hypothetical protein
MKTILAMVGLALVAGCAAKGPVVAADAKAAASRDGDAPKAGTLAYDKSVWFSLLENHKAIRREIKHLPNGLEATTESDDPKVAAMIKDHTVAMQKRVRTKSAVRVWDPVFVDLFKNGHLVTMQYTETEKGVKIVETSDDPETVMLLKSHAEGVSEFVREGFEASKRETKRYGK